MTNKDSFSCGFFNSIDHDRKYDASKMGELFEGLIRDGVYLNWGDEFAVTATDSPNTVTIGTGRAWLNRTWCVNDALMIFDELEEPDLVNYRYDAIVLDVDFSDDVRAVEIKAVTGVGSRITGSIAPASSLIVTTMPDRISPALPTLLKEDGHYQYPICYIFRRPREEIISQSDIIYMVRTSALPSVAAINMNVNVDNLLAQWDADWEEFKNDYLNDFSGWSDSQKQAFSNWRDLQESDFLDWFDNLRVILDGDVAGHLQNEIERLQNVNYGVTTIEHGGTGNEYGLIQVGKTPGVSIPKTATAEGEYNSIRGRWSHGEGYYNETALTASYAHVEGSTNIANGNASHAEGQSNTVNGTSSHVEGTGNTVSGNYSHVGGRFIHANADYSNVYGVSKTDNGYKVENAFGMVFSDDTSALSFSQKSIIMLADSQCTLSDDNLRDRIRAYSSNKYIPSGAANFPITILRNDMQYGTYINFRSIANGSHVLIQFYDHYSSGNMIDNKTYLVIVKSGSTSGGVAMFIFNRNTASRTYGASNSGALTKIVMTSNKPLSAANEVGDSNANIVRLTFGATAYNVNIQLIRLS